MSSCNKILLKGSTKIKVIQKLVDRNFASTSLAVKLTNEDIRKKRNLIFTEELERQRSHISRVEKIEVNIKSPPDECTLVMNKHISTPYDCARHIGEVVTKRAALALVNDKLWDMHQPLPESCDLKFLHFKQEDPSDVNKAFWRSCSFLLGLLAERAFKNEFLVELHSWPAPNVRTGSFICDVDLKIQDWKPRQDELRALSTTVSKICSGNYRFQRLEVESALALRMFEDNRYKTQQIPQIAQRQNKVTLYRLDDHIDISNGPMIASTDFIGRFTVAAIHPITTKSGSLYRFQGVALPLHLRLNSFAYSSILVERAKKLNVQGLQTT